MAQTRTPRRRSSAGSARSNRSTASRRRTPARRASTRSARGSSSASRSSNVRSSPRSRSSRRSSNGVIDTVSGVGSSIGSTAEKVGSSVGAVAQKMKTPALMGTAAAAGLAGGVALRSRTQPQSKFAGIPTLRNGGTLRSVAHEVQEVGKEIGKQGFRLGVGDVNMEVQRGGRKGHRDSPLEVLLHGLTSRRSNR
jgi:hypothetical protein